MVKKTLKSVMFFCLPGFSFSERQIAFFEWLSGMMSNGKNHHSGSCHGEKDPKLAMPLTEEHLPHLYRKSAALWSEPVPQRIYRQ